MDEIFNAIKVFSVSEFNTFVKEVLSELGSFKVQGEITEMRITQNKGVNITLSDGKANLRVGGYAPNIKGIDLVEKDMDVVVQGTADLYVPYGSFSLSAFSIEPVGEGSLAIAYQKLKEKLEKEGLFAEEHKQALPRFITRVALLTGKDSAAFSDFIKILKESKSGIEIDYYPVLVQGNKSVDNILSALKIVQKSDVDVIVITRGGGSLEDLKSFNDEELSRSVFSSPKLVIAGVGHEKDESICDFVADVRASTPSQAAYYIADINKNFIEDIKEMGNKISEILIEEILAQTNLLDSKTVQIENYVDRLVNDKINILEGLERILDTFNTENVLKRGFAIIQKDGKQVDSIKDVSLKDKIKTILKDGYLNSEVNKISPHKNAKEKRRDK